MKRRTTGRFVLALVVLAAVYQLGFVKLLSAGASAAGFAGIVLALLLGGLLIAVVFTAVYDGPRALLGLIRPWRRTTGIRAR